MFFKLSKDSLWVVGDARMSQRYVWDVNGSVTDKGRLLAVRLGAGVTASYRYNPMVAMTRRILSGTGFGQSFADTLSWTVRAGDQARTGMVLPGGVSQSYIYDGLDRLGWMSLKWNAQIRGSDNVSAASAIVPATPMRRWVRGGESSAPGRPSRLRSAGAEAPLRYLPAPSRSNARLGSGNRLFPR